MIIYIVYSPNNGNGGGRNGIGMHNKDDEDAQHS